MVNSAAIDGRDEVLFLAPLRRESACMPRMTAKRVVLLIASMALLVYAFSTISILVYNLFLRRSTSVIEELLKGHRRMLTCGRCNDSKEAGNKLMMTALQNSMLNKTSLIQRASNGSSDSTTNSGNSFRGQYSIWRREYENYLPDSALKTIKDQIIMAEIYASIARSQKLYDLASNLTDCIKENEDAISEANSDADLIQGVHEQSESLGHVLSLAQGKLYNCSLISRKLLALMQSAEESIASQKAKNLFLLHYTSRTLPKSLLCLHLQLMTDYHIQGYHVTELADKSKSEDPSLYHYALFSDNVLAASVVVNSTIKHVGNPEKHAFHVVTNKLTYAAMKTWFIVHTPGGATVEVQSVDDFPWLKSTEGPTSPLDHGELQSRSAHSANQNDKNDHHKYANPRYLSPLNHLRFHLPDLFPKLEKILFLDDDVVVQDDLTPLWSVEMAGMVNGAVENCGNGYNRLNSLLNFSDPRISGSFDPFICAWGFGMNMFDLVEWRNKNITGRYLHWQEQNKDGALWKLGSSPAGQVAFYNATYLLSPMRHLMSLGYNPMISPFQIEAADVIHYNGPYKPWTDLAIPAYKMYWSSHVNFSNPYLQDCNFVP